MLCMHEPTRRRRWFGLPAPVAAPARCFILACDRSLIHWGGFSRGVPETTTLVWPGASCTETAGGRSCRRAQLARLGRSLRHICWKQQQRCVQAWLALGRKGGQDYEVVFVAFGGTGPFCVSALCLHPQLTCLNPCSLLQGQEHSAWLPASFALEDDQSPQQRPCHRAELAAGAAWLVALTCAPRPYQCPGMPVASPSSLPQPSLPCQLGTPT